ncbi:hypothetical protein [Kitasatospora kifunensis]|uniref:Uncharacterized protein n=1 Tax=Kitasatospora kifunensis TaxID=58351 RepID=A0A7W7RBX4_KITKI|nr:hypothetical protein [Kitasatospora kifunensis]MBB4929152.1 hypothetical protein [Kitasatospora kifunensis]
MTASAPPEDETPITVTVTVAGHDAAVIRSLARTLKRQPEELAVEHAAGVLPLPEEPYGEVEVTRDQIVATRLAVERQEKLLRNTREQLLAQAVSAVMTDPGAWGRNNAVAAWAGFTGAHLSAQLTPEQRETARLARQQRAASKKRG